MQTIKNATHFVGKVFLVEGVLLLVITVLWRLTTWHTTTNYGFALFTTGGILIGMGLIGLAGRGSTHDTKLMEAEMEMRSWDHKGQRRFISSYAESTRLMRWLIGIGFVTVGIATAFNSILP